MNKHDFPKIHFYDQDFVDIYNKTWTMLSDYWIDPKTGEKSSDGYFIYHTRYDFICPTILRNKFYLRPYLSSVSCR